MKHPIWLALEEQAEAEWGAAVMASPKDHFVYRYFDGRDNLLYVGSTKNFHRRDLQHRRSAKWYGRVYRHTLSGVMPAQMALGFECLAIREEDPIFNSHRATGYAGPGSRIFDKRLAELYDGLPFDDQMTLKRHALDLVAEALNLT